jgi:hypothetical protein
LAGTNDGKLFGLFEGTPYIIAEINQTTAEILSKTSQDMIRYTSDSSYFFLSVGDNSFTDIFFYNSITKTTVKQTTISNGIIGAAASAYTRCV